MEKFIEATGKTIDDAISSALAQLGIERDSVSVEVLEKPKPGFLGIGGSPAKVKVTYSVSRLERTTEFLRVLLEKMNITAGITESENAEGHIHYDISGENMGVLIGRRGETLEAVQHITGYVANKGEGSVVRVTVDTEGYRAKREEALIALAEKMAEKAVKYRRNMVLEPMNSYARHVIHAHLQNNPNVTTHSTGVDPNRRIVIAVPGGERPQSRQSKPWQGNSPQSGRRYNSDGRRPRP